MYTNYSHIEARAQVFEEVGARPPRSRIYHEVGKDSDKLIPMVVEDGKAERVGEVHSEYHGKLQEREQPLPDAKELIASLFERGYKVWPPVPSLRNVSATYGHRPDRPNPIDS